MATMLLFTYEIHSTISHHAVTYNCYTLH